MPQAGMAGTEPANLDSTAAAMGAKLYEDFVFSCVADSGFKFQMQAQNLAATLVHLAGVPGSHIIVHTVAGLDPALTAWLQRLGVTIQPIHPFAGHAYCNKLAQLTSVAAADRPFVVMMDCDIAVTGPIQWPKPRRIAAKRVDTAAPPRSVLAGVFAAAQLGEPRWVDSDLLPGPEGRCTDRNNCNGGVYVADRDFLARLAPVWLRWAGWCLENRSLFGAYGAHVDQVSLALAARELDIEIEPLPRSLNMPTHLPVAPEADVDARVLHYHWQVDDQLFLKTTGLPRVDTAIARVNDCLMSTRRTAFLNSVFFGARYELFPQLGAGVGSQGENLRYKQQLLQDLVSDPEQSVLEVGCGDLAVSCGLPVTRYLGIDIASTAVDAARRLRPDWEFLAGNAADIQVEARDVVICLDVLIHQPTRAQYRTLVEKLCALARDTLIVGAYDCEPAFTSSITFYYEPITRTLAECGAFTEVSVVGRYRDIFVVAARKRPVPAHRRDLGASGFNLMSAVTDYPLFLRLAVDRARADIGFFPAHTPRALEYPWILANLPRRLEGESVLDVGAGVNPLPLMLAGRGAAVFTVDSHAGVCDIARREDWNEWGFLDYSRLDGRITSVQTAYERWAPGVLFDFIYSVSVIEHLPAEIRRLWIANFEAQLKSEGSLLLTVDLIPETDRLWNFSAGRIVECEEVHGTLDTLLEELRKSGFTIEESRVKRNIPGSRVDVGFLRARRSLRPSAVSAGMPCLGPAALHNLDRLNELSQPLTLNGVRAEAGRDFTFEGWAADAEAGTPARGVEIVVDGVPYEARYGTERHDVAAHFGRPEYLRSGYRMSLPGTLFGAGEHEIRMRVISARGVGYWEGCALRIRCTPADGGTARNTPPRVS